MFTNVEFITVAITNYCRNGETAVRQRPCGSG